MEDYIKESAETATSNFFSTKINQYHSPPQLEKETNSIFNKQAQNENPIQQLESRLLALESILDQLKDHYNTVNSDTTLDEWHHYKMVNLEQLRMNNQSIEKQLKRDILYKFEKLDKELQEMQKNRKQLKSKYQNLLNDGLQEIKTLKKQVFSSVSDTKEQKAEQFRKKNLLLKKQLQKLRRSDRIIKNEVFANLELTRNKFHERVKNEENKRSNLNNIIQFLLEKTCNKAQDTIQRRLYQHSIYGNGKI